MKILLPASFYGPSMYFSKEALKACEQSFLNNRHIELIYATLAAWGMHRSGEYGAKMPDYQDFKKSILVNRETLSKLRNKRIECLSRKEFEDVLKDLRHLCFDEDGICASKTKSKVVSASKTLAHILPNLVPPIDRQYTACYFNYNKGNFTRKREKDLLEIAMRTLFSLYQDNLFVVCAKRFIYINYNNTISLPKLFDYLIVEAVSKKSPPKIYTFSTLREKIIYRGTNFLSPKSFLNIYRLKITLYLKLPLRILKKQNVLNVCCCRKSATATSASGRTSMSSRAGLRSRGSYSGSRTGRSTCRRNSSGPNRGCNSSATAWATPSATPSSSSCCRSSWRGWCAWWGSCDGTPTDMEPYRHGTPNGVLRKHRGKPHRATDIESLTGFSDTGHVPKNRQIHTRFNRHSATGTP